MCHIGKLSHNSEVSCQQHCLIDIYVSSLSLFLSLSLLISISRFVETELAPGQAGQAEDVRTPGDTSSESEHFRHSRLWLRCSQKDSYWLLGAMEVSHWLMWNIRHWLRYTGWWDVSTLPSHWVWCLNRRDQKLFGEMIFQISLSVLSPRNHGTWDMRHGGLSL